MILLHIAKQAEWQTAVNTGLYHTPSLETEGFIHCSTPQQLLGPANALFRGQTDLLLLCIRPDAVQAPIVYEDCYDAGEAFPHIYGPLNLDAVIKVLPFPPHADGTFSLPPAVKPLLLETAASPLEAAYPILEFDPTPTAIIEPAQILAPIDIPPHCVLCFFQDTLTALHEAGQLHQIYQLGSEIGSNPVYEMQVNEQRLAVLHPGVGAPLAAAFLEELIALGCRSFIVCGGCGVLDGQIELGQVVVVESAVRDEGTSYHYLPPSREVAASPQAIAAIDQVLKRHHIDHIIGKTWTTDAIYRETPVKAAQRRAEGCLTVEMEAAAFFAVAQFRQVVLGQLLYGGDSLDGDQWDLRNWQQHGSAREKLFWLAVEACLTL